MESKDNPSNKAKEVAGQHGPRWWHCGLSSTRDRLRHLKTTAHLSDLTLVFANNRKMMVHRLVLAVSSPVLETMVYGLMACGPELHLPHDCADAFDWLLDHLYFDVTHLPSIPVAIKVYGLAHKYHIDSTVKVCSQYLVEEVSAETFPTVFDAALLYEDTTILQRCSEVLAANSESVLASSELGVMRWSSLKQLLQHPRLYVTSETTVMHAVMAWGLDNLDTEEDENEKQFSSDASATGGERQAGSLPNKESSAPAADSADSADEPALQDESLTVYCTAEKLRRTIEDFLPYVRFLSMTADEIIKVVMPSGILTGDEAMAILQKIKGVESVHLPHFVSSVKHRESGVRTVVLVSTTMKAGACISYYYHNTLSFNLLQNFQVNRMQGLVQVLSTCVVSLGDGVVHVWDGGNEVMARGVWRGSQCTFKRALWLIPGRSYTVVLTLQDVWCATAHSQIAVTHKKVTYSGQSLCHGRVEIVVLKDPLKELPDV